MTQDHEFAVTFIEPDVVFVEGGTYVRGDCSGSQLVQPCRQVRIGGLYVSKFELTVREYQQCVSAGVCSALDFGLLMSKVNDEWSISPKAPAFGLSWIQAEAYVNWISEVSGKSWRLPSESEWEYFARAGSDSSYYWGPFDDCTRANTLVGRDGCSGAIGAPSPVGSFEPNAWGLYDILGNVSELTLDCWVRSYSSHGDTAEPNLSGDCSKRVKRGGGWHYSTGIKVMSRWPMPVDRSQIDDGLRLVLDASEVSNSITEPTR
ncbi:MAG: SUMF1/EgtB/PvdO family nonheme iron enzyme [Pseudomonadales bacterium]